MISFRKIISELESIGYANGPAQAKLAHDIVLKALEKCGFGKNVTVKGSVVMSSITGDIRRATMDMDIDFVNYSLADSKIDALVKKLNCLDGVTISRQGPIIELRQQHYRGKRIHLKISDSGNVTVVTKIDIGVHTYAAMLQHNLKFDIVLDVKGAKLPANSKEQMFSEKLKSLLKFGTRSNRPKDVFDMHFLANSINKPRLRSYIKLLIFDDPAMRERTFSDIHTRIAQTFRSKIYLSRLSTSKSNWLALAPSEVTQSLMTFLSSL